MRLPTPLLVSFLALALLSPGLSARATILVQDNFTNSSGSGVALVSDTEAVGTGSYATILGSNGMTVTAVAGFGSGNVLSLANGTQTYHRPFSSLTFDSLAAGQTLSLSFDLRFATGSFSGADNFSFGFISDTAPASLLYANLDLSASGGLTSEFRYRTGSFNMSDNAASVILPGGSFTEPSTAVDTNYALALSITREVEGGYTIEYFRDSVLRGSTTLANGSPFALATAGTPITGIAFRHSNTPNIITYLDNVTVAVIPEPVSGLLVLFGFLATFFARDRKGTRHVHAP